MFLTTIFSNNADLHVFSISLSVFPTRTNMKLHNISVTLELVKVNHLITNLYSSKASVPDCIPLVVLKDSEPHAYQLNFSVCV